MVNDGQSLFSWINKKPWYEWVISGILGIGMVLLILAIELVQWIIIVRMMFQLFGVDYVEYARLMPFVCMLDGENSSFVIFVASIILTILIIIFILGNSDVKVSIAIFEILAIGIAMYIVVWVIAVAFVMILAGLRFGKWSMVGAFLIAVLIHAIFCLVWRAKKTYTRIR